MNRDDISRLIFESIERRRLEDVDRLVAATADDGMPKDFRRTRTFDQVVDAITLGSRIRANLVLIHGQNGGGKTTALRAFAAFTPQARYWEIPAGHQPKHLLRDIVTELPVHSGDGWRLLTGTAIEYLRDHPHIFLLDEAQRLDYACLDLLKYIADNSGSMFVLAASPSLALRIEKWPDIASRCPVRSKVEPITPEEFVELYQVDGWTLETLEEIHKLSRGVMRTIRALFLVLDDYLATMRQSDPSLTRATFGAQHVRAIAGGVVPVAVHGELVRRS